MQIFTNTNFDIIGKRRIAYAVSSVFVLLGIVGIIAGLNFGIDFTGGTLVQVKFDHQVQADEIRDVLKTIGLDTAEIQSAGRHGDEVLIRAPQMDETEIGNIIKDALAKEFGEENLDLRREEQVGPKIGSELRTTAIYAILFSLGFMILYIWVRFDLRFGVAAVIALFHDVMIVLGIFWVTRQEISLAVIAAVLTVVGYSINDTIVVFDRIRENLRSMRRAKLLEIVNVSINQTLSRTVITSFTTFMVVFLVLIFGGEVLFGFALALTIGIITGTYSSIFMASPVVIEWANYQEKKMHERLQTKRPTSKKARRRSQTKTSAKS